MSDKPIVLSCADVSKAFNDVGDQTCQVLESLSLDVMQGEMVAIMGRSGSGKSTLMHILGGLDTPDSGQVKVLDHSMGSIRDVVKSGLRNKHLGFVYQFHHLLPEFNALENVSMPCLLSGERREVAEEKASAIIERVGLGDRRFHKVAELSGGQRQRIAIARALVMHPSCVLADEPTGNLDEKSAEQVFDLMLELNQTLNISFLVVTHHLDLAKKMHRSLELRSGRLYPLT